jgi:UDP-N-acetylglucosamine 3-dehydrogenase
MTVSIALVGLEQHVSYVLKGLDEAPHLRLVAAAALGNLGDSFATERQIPVYNSHRALLENESFDVLAVFLAPNQQGSVVLDALRAGKHVITDKPLTTDVETFAQVVEESARRPQLEIGMLLTLRGMPEYRAVKQVIESGAIGTPALAYAKRAAQLKRATRASWFFDRRLSGGLMPDLAVHDVDFLTWATGLRYRQVTAYELNVGNPDDPYMDDAGAAIFQLESGIPALVEYHRLLQAPFGEMDYRVKVVGTRGQVELSPGGQVSVITETDKTIIQDLPPAQNVFVDFAEAAATGRLPIISTPQTLHAMDAALAARQSARSGRTVSITRY